MVGRGQAPFFLSIIATLLLILTNEKPAYAFADAATCFNPTLRSVGYLGQTFAEDAKPYNQLIAKSLKDLTPELLEQDFVKIFEDLEKAKFPYREKEFLEWYRLNPYSQAEIDAMHGSQKNLGHAIHEKIIAFEKFKAHPNLDAKINELDAAFKKAQKECGQDINCHKRIIAPIFSKELKNPFSCIAVDRDIRQAAITGFAVANAGVIINQVRHEYLKTHSWKEVKTKDIAYEDIANSALWAPIFGEIACRQKAAMRSDQVGKPLENKSIFTVSGAKNFGKVAALSYAQYMLWSPADGGSWVLFHMIAEKARGNYVDPNKWKIFNHSDFWKETALLTLWDGVYAVPRTVLVMDPLFGRVMPEYLKPYLGNHMPAQVAGGAYVATESAMRVAHSGFNNWWFHKFLDKFTPYFENSPSSKGKVPTASSCRPKFDNYEKCLSSCTNFRSESENFHTPTCAQCAATLDTYESECGSYY